MMIRSKEALRAGGLHITKWPGGKRTVVGLAGLTSTSSAWSYLASALPDWTVVAPDLRGRGGSFELDGPPGLHHHAGDVTKVLDELDLYDVTLVGHSMGAYLAPVVALQAPGRVKALVLVDGGIPPAFPFFLRPGVVRLQFRRQLRVMQREWPDVETFARHAKLEQMIRSRPDLRQHVLDMIGEELSEGSAGLRPLIKSERAIGDAVDTFFGPDVPAALEALAVPARVLIAENARREGQRPFISDRAVAKWTSRQPNLEVQRLPGNHLTILFAPEVAQTVSA